MISTFINLIIYLVILGLLYYVAIYIIDAVIPEPPARILKIAVMVFTIIAVVVLLLDLIGVGPGIGIRVGAPRLDP